MQAKVSIVIPCFNSEATLRPCLESIARLGRPELEVVLIDGGSTDRTLAIAREYPGIIRHLHSGPDGGIYDGMNKGVMASSGQWILFLGSDDLIHPQFLHALDRLAVPSRVYHGDVVLKGSGSRYGGVFTARRLQFENICHQAILYPREAFRDRMFNCEYGILGDHEFNLYCMGALGLEFAHVDALIAVYNDLSGASFWATDVAFERDRIHLALDYFGPVVAGYVLVRLMLYRLKLRITGRKNAGRPGA
jgi:glycosyltransferase involved in cell wall biosynthesis